MSAQNEYSLLHRDPERDVLPECARLGLAFIPYFPLASGLLTGKYRRGQPAPEGRQVRANAGAAGWTLTQADLVEIDAIMAPAGVTR